MGMFRFVGVSRYLRAYDCSVFPGNCALLMTLAAFDSPILDCLSIPTPQRLSKTVIPRFWQTVDPTYFRLDYWLLIVLMTCFQ